MLQGQETLHPVQRESRWQFPPGLWTEEKHHLLSWYLPRERIVKLTKLRLLVRDLATNMLDKKNEGHHKASDASHPGDESQEAKQVDSPSCSQLFSYPIPCAERPAQRFPRVIMWCMGNGILSLGSNWSYSSYKRTVERFSLVMSKFWRKSAHPNSPPTDTVTMANMRDLSLPKLSDTLEKDLFRTIWLMVDWLTSQRSRSQRACQTYRGRCRWCASTRCCRGRWTPPPGWRRPPCGRPTSPQPRTAELILHLKKVWKAEDQPPQFVTWEDGRIGLTSIPIGPQRHLVNKQISNKTQCIFEALEAHKRCLGRMKESLIKNEWRRPGAADIFAPGWGDCCTSQVNCLSPVYCIDDW